MLSMSYPNFFDPLGVISQVTVIFNIFAQWLCADGAGWDKDLSGDHLRQWQRLSGMHVESSKTHHDPTVHLPRCHASYSVSQIAQLL